MLNNFLQRLITGVIILLVFLISFFFLPDFFIFLIQFAIPMLIFVELKKLFKINNLQGYLPAIIYAFVPFTLINAMYQNEFFKLLVPLLFATTFLFDSACYITGRLIGKTKICPKISPGKTWGGFIGGYLTLITLFSLIIYLTKKQTSLCFVLFFAFVCAFFAFIGDIFESWLKRKAGVKDSGSILPGHGGMLDRFDSVLFLAIIFYIFKTQIVIQFF